MLNDLKFVMGAVAKKDFVPSLQYFKITGGRILGFNGVIAISTPTDLAVDAMPKAVPFIKAIERVPEGAEVALNLTNAGRLSLKAGPFRAYVELSDNADYPDIVPKGEIVPLAPGLLAVLRALSPFMGIDASRPWAMGIRLVGQSAFATNNICLVEHWLPMAFPSQLIIPSMAITEMLRIKVEPTGIQVEERAVTFHYPSGAWLRTAVVDGEWPDLSRILDQPHGAAPIHPELFDAVKRLDAFTEKDNRIFLREGIVATSATEGDGALVELPGFAGVGCHHLTELLKLDEVATHIDWTTWPGPCLFFGGMMRGAIIGMRIADTV